VEMRKHTAISKYDLNEYQDYKSGEVVSYFLSPEELGNYKILPVPVQAKIFNISSRKKNVTK
jgi:hypothetical protein